MAMTELTIRMYDVGFGDCFLLTFGKGNEARRVLFDCGSISAGAKQVTTVAEHVIETCRGADGRSKIELIVCTHRHRDHVGGFSDPRWDKVEVGEVWMPWTEDPDDKLATKIRTRQSGFAATLADALNVGAALDSDPLTSKRSLGGEARKTMLAIALNALTNEKAMQTLHSGFSGKPPRHFLPVKDKPCEARALESLPGITFHILGPPRDEDAIASMDPPKGGAYLAKAAAGDAAPVLANCAFRPKWRLDRAAFDQRHPQSTFSAGDQKQIDVLADEPEGSVAAAIDRAVNNTSLIILIEAGNQWLLFPGDAQWGSWNSALGNDQCRSLMKRTTFYKVGHHGSENATPKTAVEDVFKDGLISFFSTASIKQWPNVPRRPLVEAIAKKGKIARSDNEAIGKRAGFIVQTGLYTEWTIDTAA
jgi:beta-lactamase superfamily II metal-dependent hydrolase